MIVALAGALSVGCGAAGDATGTPFGVDQPQVWLDGGSLGYDAQQAWGLPLDAPYTVVTMPESRIIASCPVQTNEFVGGCTDLNTHLIMVLDTLNEGGRSNVLLHEMGHALARNGLHLSDGCFDDNRYSKHVMCAYAAPLDAPTPDDFGYVLSPPSE